MIIDFHTHTFPDKIAIPTVNKMQKDCHIPAYTYGMVSELKESMNQSGIDYSVVLPVMTNPLKVSSINDVSIELTGKDGLIYFGGIHPDAPNWYEELGRIADAGLKGIKIHPVYQNTDIDDIKFLRILERAAELGLIVITHSGYDIGFPGATQCIPEKVLNAVNQVGNLKFVLAHMGGWRQWEKAAELLAQTDVYIDTAFSLGCFERFEDNYYNDEQRQLLSEKEFCELIRLFGSKRVIFGTDSPWTKQEESKNAILALPISDEEKTDILSGNAIRLLGL